METGRGGKALRERVWRSSSITVLCSILGMRTTSPATVPCPTKDTFSALCTWTKKWRSTILYLFITSYFVLQVNIIQECLIDSSRFLFHSYLSPSLRLQTERRHYILWVVSTNHKKRVGDTQEVKSREVCICSGEGGKQLAPGVWSTENTGALLFNTSWWAWWETI